MSTESSPRAIIAALLANLGIAVTKLIAWALTGASSMLAESIHSLADSGNQGLLLFGGKRARRAPTTENHQFGFGRERYVYAFIVSIVLFSVGGLFALYEAYHKWHEIHEGHRGRAARRSNWWWVPLVVLVAAIVMEGFSFRTAIVESNKVKRRPVVVVDSSARAKAPELPVVLLEDFAALIGLVLRAHRRRDDAAHRQRLLGRRRHRRHRHAPRRRRDHARHRDQEPAARRVGGERRPATRSGPRSLGASDDILDVIHLRTLHVGPEELLVASRSPSHRRTARRTWREPSTRRRPGSARPCPRRSTSSSSRTSAAPKPSDDCEL